MSTPLLTHAIDRCTVRVAFHLAAPDADGRTPSAVIFPLWPELEIAPGQPFPRTDMWRCLYRDDIAGRVTWRPGHIAAGDITVIEVDPIAMPADIVTEARPGTFQRAELLCVCARFGVPIRFAYDRGQGVYEARRGVPLGFKAGKDAPLLVLADADRDGAIRSFKTDAVSGILAATLPRWVDGVGWMAAPAEIVDPDADAAGVTGAEVAAMVDRRQS